MTGAKKDNKIQSLAKGATASPWKELWLYKKENRQWLKKSRDIAMKILDTLEEKEMTQIHLAQQLRVSRQQVSKIVKGQENLTLETISRLEEVLGVELILTNMEIGKPKKVSPAFKKKKGTAPIKRG
ncbi:helix-turn-helix transcriptional regulator [Chryseolinea lacunae]|uniref:Helix-turn-helix transcriptional regulator n=1 Tax=Chryseolinea lacunae TaxID=2801331 RepID=A0ABS1KNI2_9BACT|nr:helix-turn-helix transcriptional regulator [Chryseolinea lacunae]MBL0740788.1 helix-turn-helix transcriptional regulator [Chryseolinea lacunae]